MNGFVSGLGAAIGDTVFAIVTGFGLTTLVLLAWQPAHAQAYSVLHSFTRGQDGVVHAFINPGSYLVRHTVVDDSGHPCNTASEQALRTLQQRHLPAQLFQEYPLVPGMLHRQIHRLWMSLMATACLFCRTRIRSFQFQVCVRFQ